MATPKPTCALGLLRGLDLNQRPLGYEPNELPDCSTPHTEYSEMSVDCQALFEQRVRDMEVRVWMILWMEGLVLVYYIHQDKGGLHVRIIARIGEGPL